jgi:short-subunit dehydrogenase
MNQKSILIIGASGDLGKSISKKFIQKNYQVYATYNKNKKNLNKKKFCNIYKLNLSNIKSVKIFSNKIKNIKFNIILFIAAVTPHKNNIKDNTFGDINTKSLLEFFFINCVANIKLFEYLLRNNCINKNGKIVFFSSLAGSIHYRGKLKHNKKFGNMSYRISKASLNSAVKNMAYDLDESGYIVISMHPGYIKTSSKNRNSTLKQNLATKYIYNTILNLKKKDHGKFINYDGSYLKW